MLNTKNTKIMTTENLFNFNIANSVFKDYLCLCLDLVIIPNGDCGQEIRLRHRTVVLSEGEKLFKGKERSPRPRPSILLCSYLLCTDS